MELENLNTSKSEMAKKIKALHSGTFRAIVKVKKRKHVPKGFTVRSWVDDFMFTADLTKQAAEAVLSDASIESISLGEKLNLIQ